jgi:hypothetical protein
VRAPAQQCEERTTQGALAEITKLRSWANITEEGLVRPFMTGLRADHFDKNLLINLSSALLLVYVQQHDLADPTDVGLFLCQVQLSVPNVRSGATTDRSSYVTRHLRDFHVEASLISWRSPRIAANIYGDLNDARGCK